MDSNDDDPQARWQSLPGSANGTKSAPSISLLCSLLGTVPILT
jgi:hypothetical protein